MAAQPQPLTGRLPEVAAVHWRPRVDDARLDRAGRVWTLVTVAHTVPFIVGAVLMVAIQPLALPVAVACIAHAWIIPELYAQRGANVVRPKPAMADPGAERVSVGLLGDLIGHEPRELHARTGLVLERGRLGAWLVGPTGALLVRPGARRVHCWCVRVNEPELPTGDRVAHLLLAVRADEQGFATVANQAFAGARWRVRRRLTARQRPALDEAVRAAKRLDRGSSA